MRRKDSSAAGVRSVTSAQASPPALRAKANGSACCASCITTTGTIRRWPNASARSRSTTGRVTGDLSGSGERERQLTSPEQLSMALHGRPELRGPGQVASEDLLEGQQSL